MSAIPYFVDVASANTFLDASEFFASWMSFAEEKWDERVHASSGEEHGWVIVRDQRSARDNGVAMVFEEI
jgi:hypothetical protein